MAFCDGEFEGEEAPSHSKLISRYKPAVNVGSLAKEQRAKSKEQRAKRKEQSERGSDEEGAQVPLLLLF